MSLPTLYEHGLMQKARTGLLELTEYKLGLLEALLKQTLRELDAGHPPEAVRARLRSALDVILWEMRPPWRDRAPDPPRGG